MWTRRQRRRVMAGAVIGLVLALVAMIGVLGVTAGPELADVPVSMQRVEVVRSVPSVAPSAVAEAPVEPRRAALELDELPLVARTRAEWARDRAEWTGDRWVLCDLSPLRPSSAEVIFDEHGYDGPIDPATSVMVVDDGWLALTVREAVGDAVVDVSDLFDAEERVRIRWDASDPVAPGRCTGAPEPVEPTATLVVTAVELDGSTLADPDGVDTAVFGCGASIELGQAVGIEAGTCALSLERRRSLLPSQVTRGPIVTVEAGAGDTVHVTLVAPRPPGVWSLPDLADTQQLLDVVAFSGNDTMADTLDLVLDDLERGEFDPELVEVWGFRAGMLAGSRPDSAFDAIGRSWELWAEVQELRDDERP